MTKDYSICIGTVGQGLWQVLMEARLAQDAPAFPLESRVRALAPHPPRPTRSSLGPIAACTTAGTTAPVGSGSVLQSTT